MNLHRVIPVTDHFHNQLNSSEGKGTLGNFKMTIQEESEYLIDQDSAIEMSSGNHFWQIKADLTEEKMQTVQSL